jgi:hypothetical protein
MMLLGVVIGVAGLFLIARAAAVIERLPGP